MKRLLTLLLLALPLLCASQEQEIFVNDGGTLREIQTVWINDAGTLRQIKEGWINDGGTLRQIYSLLEISPLETAIIKSRFDAQCWAGVRFDTSGNESTLGNTNSWLNDLGIWLNVGTAVEVWVERILNSGTLNHLDPGAGRKRMDTLRSYSVTQVSNGIHTANVTFNFYNAASGGTLLKTVTYQIQAANNI